MDKIALKSWQKILVFSVLGVLVLMVVINIIMNRTPEQKPGTTRTFMNINIQPSDSCNRLFYNGEVRGDSVQFETISGSDEGWIFQVFGESNEIHYSLLLDFRQSDHVWKKGDSLIFSSDTRSLNMSNPLGLFNITLQSQVEIAKNNYVTDKLSFSKYYIVLRCRRYDSLASFDGIFRAEEYVRNPEYYKDKMVLTGSFRAENILLGKRIVN